MERGSVTVETPDKGLGRLEEYSRVAVINRRPEPVSGIEAALGQIASRHVTAVHVWVAIDRFHAPASTPLPYRSLARREARCITSQRVTQGEAEARKAVEVWQGYGWQTEVEVILDATPSDLAGRLVEQEIELVASEPGSADLARRAAILASRPLLLVPARNSTGDGIAQRESPDEARDLGSRILRAFHG
jgi:hypothetical protein